MKKLIFLPLFLAACAGQPGTDNGFTPVPPTVVVQTERVYPDFPPIPLPPPINLNPVTADMPRDETGTIISDSNVYLGFDLNNWNNLQENLAKLKEYIILLKARIQAANDQRAEWRRLNDSATPTSAPVPTSN